LIGSYSLGLKVFNLYLMNPVGSMTYYLTGMVPIPPLVIA
jgi:putative tricarboxylic transport membrane protein